MNYLVSGATGFIGRELCRQLSASEASFVALSRTGGILPGGKNTLAVDFTTQSIGGDLFAGVDVVFHLAGIAHQRADKTVYEAVNHRATLNMAAAAAEAGVRCFIFLSSVKAMGAPTGAEVRVEEDCHPTCEPYGQSKRQAELGLQAKYANSEMSVIILRPALVYGAGAAGNLELMARAVRSGIPRPPDRGARSMVGLLDLVAVLRQLGAQPPAGLHTWIICDGEFYRACQIHDLMRMALGRAPSRSWLPVWFWRLGCNLRDIVSGARRGSSYDKLFASERYSSAAVQQSLGWHPKHRLTGSVRDIMACEAQLSEDPA